MIKYFISFCLFLFICLCASAQSPEGLWKNIDDDGHAKSIIQIQIVEGVLSARVVEFLPAATITHCNKCTGDEKGKSLLDLNLLDGLRKHDDTWRGGTILNPKTGKKYRTLLSFEDNNTLNVRGYIGKPIFGKTYQWKRVTETRDGTQ